MTVVLHRPQPLPPERVRFGAILWVAALHLALLWVANLYWPLQNLLLAAAQNSAPSITLQIFKKSLDSLTSPAASSAEINSNPQAISRLGRQRFGRAEAMLGLPATQTEATTPLAGTAQTALTALLPVVSSTPPMPGSQAKVDTVKPEAVKPEAVKQEVAKQEVAKQEVAMPEPQVAALPTAPAPAPVAAVPTDAPNNAAGSTPIVQASSAEPSPVRLAATSGAVSAPSTSTSTITSKSTSASINNNGAGNQGSAASSAAGSSQGAISGTPASAASSAGAPLNLNLPPRYIYRPPIVVPRRSLSDMANDQLRRKPRDPFAEGIESAGNIDCLKDNPDGPAQGLLAIGPLLKRVIEEKCRK